MSSQAKDKHADWAALWKHNAEGHLLMAAAYRAYAQSAIASGDQKRADHCEKLARDYQEMEASALHNWRISYEHEPEICHSTTQSKERRAEA